MENNQVARFTALWTQTQSSVLAYIATTVTNFADAEDVLQKVAGVAVNKFDQFDLTGDSRAFTCWAIRIAKFEVLNYLRSKSTDRARPLIDSLDTIADAFETLAPQMDDRRHALAECMKQMQGRTKEVLVRRYGDGMKTSRIAESMKLSPGNVSVILNRAYKSLRNCIDSRLAMEAGQ
ncbi:MAG: sigma-70 family RNA polymerase sigma factor [Planctomycetota bacterium]